jgi:aerobic-type carbon monoxide dehydrogenase small subunit (CoxS/CutS family)
MRHPSTREVAGNQSAPLPAKTIITLTVNGIVKQIEVRPWITLLDLLRERLDLTGTKKGCDHGQCGACTVLVNGKRINSCMTLAIMQEGAQVVTIEGLAQGDALHPLQVAFVEHDAFQCGYCTPGQICSGIGLITILGASEHCIATHPSDMCVALAALEAVVRVTGKNGDRTIPFAEFHRLPGDTPHLDSNLQADEIITAVDLPAKGFAEHYTYLKVRDRRSYAFALVSVAAGLEMDGDTIRQARLALGGVAHKPWRDVEAEAMLSRKNATKENFQKVADFVMRDAKASATTLSKYSWRNAPLFALLRKPRKWSSNHDDNSLHRPSNQPH